MDTTKILMQGIGTGAGEEITVLAKEEIREIIEDLIRASKEEIFDHAYDSWIHGFRTGMACVDMQTGELFGQGLGQNESNHAVDDQNICIFSIGQNDPDPLEITDEDTYMEFCDGEPTDEKRGSYREIQRESAIDAMIFEEWRTTLDYMYENEIKDFKGADK